MALFKVLRGESRTIDKNNVNKPPFVDGYAYFTPDDSRFYIDVQLDSAPSHYYDSETVNGKTIYRIEIESLPLSELYNTKTNVGHKHDRDDITNVKTLTLKGGTSEFEYDGTVDLNLDIRADWNQANENSVDFIKNKPTIINVAITVDDAAKTLFITSPVTNGDGVSY